MEPTYVAFKVDGSTGRPLTSPTTWGQAAYMARSRSKGGRCEVWGYRQDRSPWKVSAWSNETIEL